MKAVWGCLFALGLIFCCTCSKKNSAKPEAVTVEDLLIKSNEISGWQISGAGWTANNDSELFASIDGAATLYVKYEFVEAAGREYQGIISGNQATISIEIYDQRIAANARKVFDEVVPTLSNAETWQEGSRFSDARIERFPLSQDIACWKSNYYVKLTVNVNISQALDVLKTFANNIGGKIG